MTTAAFSATGSGAAAQDLVPILVPTQSAVIAPAVLSPAPAVETAPEAEASSQPATLAELVDAQAQPEALSRELQCLAGAVYFEAKSESLAGQLAVGRVVVSRAKSGRFPASYCGVVYQPSQFSFVHGKSMPTINHASENWREAVAIAQIADAGSWKGPTEGALFFHAARVSPNWHMARIARVDDHIFYR